MKLSMLPLTASILLTAAALVARQQPPLQEPPSIDRRFAEPSAYVPDLTRLVASTSELRDTVDRFAQDRQALLRFYTVPGSDERRTRLRAFQQAWLKALAAIDFARLSREGRVDYVLLRNHLEYSLKLLDREARWERDTDPLLPFEEDIVRLQEDRQKLRFVTPEAAVSALTLIGERIAEARAAPVKATPLAGQRAAQQADRLRAALDQWFGFYNGYDPGFTAKVPPVHREVSQALTDYIRFLRERVAGLAPGVAPPDNAAAAGRGGRGGGRGRGGSADAAPAGDEIVGDPIGHDGLLEDLAGEMIVYSPEQLIAIGEREYAWCENEMKKASREMGLGDDWMKALEQVKNAYVPRGGQPALIRDLALEAERYLRTHDLVTIPPLAADIWRMQMMSAERQRVNPFFTGGETISVSYPTDAMSQEEHLMSMRGNGIHVSRATVQHELIPGHHLKGFMSDRYNPHRSLFSTPFMGEGWALYWELFLWDHGFPRSPEDRVGMLWWRMHRAARIIFSLNFHLGRWTPEQCIDFLVTRVGHERFTATGEVRRSFTGAYSPLYQVAYMMGGLQIRALQHELAQSKRMTPKQFHDAVLEEGSMPIEMLRAALTDQPLTRDYRAQWKYYAEGAAPPK